MDVAWVLVLVEAIRVLVFIKLEEELELIFPESGGFKLYP